MFGKSLKVAVSRDLRDLYSSVAQGTEWEVRLAIWPDFESLSVISLFDLMRGLR